VRTARATAVVLTGATAAPHVLAHHALELWDPAVPDSRQPYHAGLGLDPAHAEPIVRRACDAARAVALAEVRKLVAAVRAAGCEPRAVGLVVGSDGDPARIANPHVRAHAAEGRLFREVLESGAAGCALPCFALVEQVAYDEAAKPLRRSADSLRRAVTELGRGVPGPWRAEEKTAALAAWVALARRG
jgi:hypothetical protein